MVDNFINKWLNNFNKYEAKSQGNNSARIEDDEASIGTNIVISINNKSNPGIETQKSVPNFKVSTKEMNGSYNNGDKNSESVVPQIEVRTVISVPALNTASMKRDLDHEDKKSPSGTLRKLAPFGPLTTRAIVDLTGDEESNSISPRTAKSDYGNGDLGDLIAMVGDDIHLPSQYGDQLSDSEEDQAEFEEDEPEPADHSKFIQLEQQVKELQKRIGELELQQQNRTRAESDLRQLNLQLIKQVQRLKNNNGDLKDENEDLLQQLNDLRESHLLMMTEKSIQALNQHEEIDRLNEVITSQRNSHLELSRMNDELHTQCTRLQNANHRLHDQVLDVLEDEEKSDKAKLAMLRIYLQGEHGTNTPPAQKKLMVSFTGSDESRSNARSTPSSPAQVQAERTRKHQRHSSMNEDKPKRASTETPLNTPASPSKRERKSSKEDGSTSPRKAKRTLSVKKGTKM
eukprot:TRINITY_DN2174_c0_g1_i2.p1 TRINITY_DN2174_c0_g1~~TRINITY_DN2174_c0_g1_i2.p1  ORF type:complete len:458 (+),score=173.22 TRINITY_DN2174_c0_g1_i2:120-1493(+)